MQIQKDNTKVLLLERTVKGTMVNWCPRQNLHTSCLWAFLFLNCEFELPRGCSYQTTFIYCLFYSAGWQHAARPSCALAQSFRPCDVIICVCVLSCASEEVNGGKAFFLSSFQANLRSSSVHFMMKNICPW